MDIQTNSKGKPTTVTTEDGTVYVCIPQTQLDRIKQDYISLVDKTDRRQFLGGYYFAMERLGLNFFGEEIPKFEPQVPEEKIRTKIKIGTQEYYEDEVLARLESLPSTKSIWRK